MKDKPGRKMVRSKSPHHRIVYSNQTQLVGTNVDIRLSFGVVLFGTPDELQGEDQVDVVLGPVQLHSLHALLSRHIDKFKLEVGQQNEVEHRIGT